MMKYKIVELNEDNLKKFDGKIIQVISSSRTEVVVGTNYLGEIKRRMWVLNCLVEVGE